MIEPGDVEGAIRQRSRKVRCSTMTLRLHALLSGNQSAQRGPRGVPLRRMPTFARSARHALVFGTGPAGTGKTWLAVAQAVQMFERKEVDRIILSRPAVEAGERLDSFPVTCAKVDPYLRPIYDALYD
jgi:phosphate starvation-inducible PhoH-like protein